MPKDENDLRKIPGVGAKIAQRLVNLGYTDISSLRGKDPMALCLEDCSFAGEKLDRCLLYVYRLAVYYADNETHDPQKLQWWNWKD